MRIFASFISDNIRLMKASISLNALFDFLQSLPLTADNKAWLADKLWESAREETTHVPGQMTTDEAKARLEASEKRMARGEYVTEEEMEDFYRTLQ